MARWALAAVAVVGVLVGASALLASSGEEPFLGNFEVGSPGWQQFTGLQYEVDRPVGDSFAIVGHPVRQGAASARLSVRHGYSRFGHGEDTSLVHHSGEKNGDEFWYAFSTLFPTDWVEPYRWGIFAEWHAQLDTSPVVAFDARADSAYLNVHSGLTDEARNAFQVNLDIPLLDSLSKGRWNDFVMRVRWTTEPTGQIEVWHRLAGQRELRRLVSLAGIPTLQRTSDGRGTGIYLLFGLYRSSYCGKPTQLDCVAAQGVQPTNTLFHDAYTRARSFDELARHAFPSANPVLCDTRLVAGRPGIGALGRCVRRR